MKNVYFFRLPQSKPNISRNYENFIYWKKYTLKQYVVSLIKEDCTMT